MKRSFMDLDSRRIKNNKAIFKSVAAGSVCLAVMLAAEVAAVGTSVAYRAVMDATSKNFKSTKEYGALLQDELQEVAKAVADGTKTIEEANEALKNFKSDDNILKLLKNSADAYFVAKADKIERLETASLCLLAPAVAGTAGVIAAAVVYEHANHDNKKIAYGMTTYENLYQKSRAGKKAENLKDR